MHKYIQEIETSQISYTTDTTRQSDGIFITNSQLQKNVVHKTLQKLMIS